MAWKFSDMDAEAAGRIAAMVAQMGKLGTRPGDPRDRQLDYSLQNAQALIQQEMIKNWEKEQKKGAKGALGGSVGKMVGTAIGFAVGGPVGAGIGASAGSLGGSALGGKADPMAAAQAGIGAYGSATAAAAPKAAPAMASQPNIDQSLDHMIEPMYPGNRVAQAGTMTYPQNAPLVPAYPGGTNIQPPQQNQNFGQRFVQGMQFGQPQQQQPYQLQQRQDGAYNYYPYGYGG